MCDPLWTHEQWAQYRAERKAFVRDEIERIKREVEDQSIPSGEYTQAHFLALSAWALDQACVKNDPRITSAGGIAEELLKEAVETKHDGQPARTGLAATTRTRAVA